VLEFSKAFPASDCFFVKANANVFFCNLKKRFKSIFALKSNAARRVLTQAHLFAQQNHFLSAIAGSIAVAQLRYHQV
jgi:hypothetical protein